METGIAHTVLILTVEGGQIPVIVGLNGVGSVIPEHGVSAKRCRGKLRTQEAHIPGAGSAAGRFIGQQPHIADQTVVIGVGVCGKPGADLAAVVHAAVVPLLDAVLRLQAVPDNVQRVRGVQLHGFFQKHIGVAGVHLQDLDILAAVGEGECHTHPGEDRAVLQKHHILQTGGGSGGDAHRTPLGDGEDRGLSADIQRQELVLQNHGIAQQRGDRLSGHGGAGLQNKQLPAAFRKIGDKGHLGRYQKAVFILLFGQLEENGLPVLGQLQIGFHHRRVKPDGIADHTLRESILTVRHWVFKQKFHIRCSFMTKIGPGS